jgi:hypothetical protein
LGTPRQIFLIIKSGIVYSMPENKIQIKIPSQKTLLNWEGRDSICFIIYPTPKASQIEKILNCHILLGMLALLQNQIASQTIYP